MDIAVLTEYFTEYGPIIIFLIVFLEYLNLPGLPSGIIMPLAGIWAYSGIISLTSTIVISLIAGLAGSWGLYFIGKYGGDFILKKYISRFPKQEKIINKNIEILRQKGSIGVFISRLIPVARTIISVPAGVLKLEFVKFTLSSAAGIFIWNGVFIGAGYFLGESFLYKFL